MFAREVRESTALQLITDRRWLAPEEWARLGGWHDGWMPPNPHSTISHSILSTSEGLSYLRGKHYTVTFIIYIGGVKPATANSIWTIDIFKTAKSKS